VESGLGIGCISRLALRDAFRRGSLVPVETPDLDLVRQFYFIWHKQKYQTSAIREFLDLCRSFTAGVQSQRRDRPAKHCVTRLPAHKRQNKPSRISAQTTAIILNATNCAALPMSLAFFDSGCTLQRDPVNRGFDCRVQQFDN
jgi:hypothetical protein